MKRPAYQWYPRDFPEDEHVKLMSLAEEGAYRRLLDHQWLHESIPADPGQLARVCKNTPLRTFQKMWPAIAPCFVATDDDPTRLINRRLERVRQEADEYHAHQSASGKRGAAARWRDKAGHDDPNGGAMATPLADQCPDDGSSSSPSPVTTTTDTPSRPETPPLARLINAMQREPDRGAVMDFLDRVPSPQYTAWVNRLASWLQGLGFPSGVCPTPGQLATACSDYAGDFSPVHVRSFVLRVVRGEVDRRQSPRAKIDATITAIEAFKKGA